MSVCVTVPRTSCFLASSVSSALICLMSTSRIRSVCRGVPGEANGRRWDGAEVSRRGRALSESGRGGEGSKQADKGTREVPEHGEFQAETWPIPGA